MTDPDPTARFSARAQAYARARPSYPAETVAILREHHRLGPETVVADVGSGTGIFSALLLPAVARVHGVEPNADMRAEAERTLGGDPRFTSVDGRAEATTLPDASVDLVTAAQAFHWFDAAGFQREVLRILRPAGHVALVWNDRDLDGAPFLRAYESILLAHCPGYRALQGKSDTPDRFDALFGEGGWRRDVAHNAQRLDRDGLVERVLSASYAPAPETPGHDALVRALVDAFERHAEDGAVTLTYTTAVIGGRPRRD